MYDRNGVWWWRDDKEGGREGCYRHPTTATTKRFSMRKIKSAANKQAFESSVVVQCLPPTWNKYSHPAATGDDGAKIKAEANTRWGRPNETQSTRSFIEFSRKQNLLARFNIRCFRVMGLHTIMWMGWDEMGGKMGKQQRWTMSGCDNNGSGLQQRAKNVEALKMTDRDHER